MSDTARHREPNTVDELIALPPAPRLAVDIARRNMVCANGLPHAEELDIDDYLERLDSWTARVRYQTHRRFRLFRRDSAQFNNSEALWRMYMLTEVLECEFGVRYNPDRVDGDPDWADSRDLFIHGLLGPKRTGTCPSLPVLIVAVGRRLDYPLRLVHSPGHVFCRWDGEDHENPAWRDRFNVEGHGKGMTNPPDEQYYEEPIKWNRELRDLEEQRGKKRMFLRSLETGEEIAADLCQRGHCLEATGDLDGAWVIYSHAWRHATHNAAYSYCCQRTHHAKMEAILEPWGITPHDYCNMAINRLHGSKVQFPWEAEGRDLDAESAAEASPDVRNVMARPLSSAATTSAARHGLVNIPKELLPATFALCYGPTFPYAVTTGRTDDLQNAKESYDGLSSSKQYAATLASSIDCFPGS